jgi:hypothetical protein
MNISPLDMQVIIPKSTEVAKSQQVKDHQSVVQQEHGAVEFQQQADVKLTQVQTTEKSQGEKIKNKQNKEQSKREASQHGSHQEEHTDEEIPMAVDTIRGRHVDIKM